MAKRVIYGDEARQKMLAGVNKLAAAVTTTLGPRGRNVALDKSWGAPNVTHDGVTIAKEISLEDKFENMGAEMVKEAAAKTNDAAGDGTTTATLLAWKIASKGMTLVTSGVNPMIMKKGIEKATEKWRWRARWRNKKRRRAGRQDKQCGKDRRCWLVRGPDQK